MFEYKYRVSSHSYVPQSTMQPLSDHIITLLNSGASGYAIHHATGASTGAISKIHSEYCPELPKSSSGHSCKLTSANINYAKRVVCMCKADNVVQVTRSLRNVTNQSISPQTVCCNLREAGLWPVVKRKHPLLKKHHRKE